MLGSSLDRIGVMLGSFWYHAGTNEFHPKCCGADFGSRIKISGNLLGQSDQNFEIYPFDWSQVASWGLAAEGEALTILVSGVPGRSRNLSLIHISEPTRH